MRKAAQIFFLLLVSALSCGGETFSLLTYFYSVNPMATNAELSDYLDENIKILIGDINKLSRSNETRLRFLNLKVALGHPKKRKNILFRDSSSEKLRHDAIPVHPWRHVKFKATLRSALLSWINDHQFAQQHPDIAELFIEFFGEYGAIKNNNNFDETMWALFPSRSLGNLTYFPWPVIFCPHRIDRLEMLYVTKGNQVKNAFGHAALLIVMNSDDEQQGHKHRLDNQYVITFRAKVPDQESLQPRKAVSGQYRSIMYFEPLSDFLSGYMFKEEREVLRLPLNLTITQIHALVANVARKQLDYSYYRFFSTNCATEMLTLFQAIVSHEEIFNNPLSPDSLIQLLVRCGIIAKEAWIERNLSFTDFMLKEEDELAFVPPAKKKRYFIQKMKEKIESYKIEFTNDDVFQRIFYGREQARLQFYKNILSELLRANKDITLLVKTMLFIEQQIEKEILFELLEQSKLSEDPDLLASEQEVEQASIAVISQINEHGGNLFAIVTNNDLHLWMESEKMIQEMLQKNWQIKRSLPLPANERINEQLSIYAFLSGLVPVEKVVD